MLPEKKRPPDSEPVVSIAGAILWGVLLGRALSLDRQNQVSIAGAILWGVLPRDERGPDPARLCFNRRGDSLGGAAC